MNPQPTAHWNNDSINGAVVSVSSHSVTPGSLPPHSLAHVATEGPCRLQQPFESMPHGGGPHQLLGRGIASPGWRYPIPIAPARPLRCLGAAARPACNNVDAGPTRRYAKAGAATPTAAPGPIAGLTHSAILMRTPGPLTMEQWSNRSHETKYLGLLAFGLDHEEKRECTAVIPSNSFQGLYTPSCLATLQTSPMK